MTWTTHINCRKNIRIIRKPNKIDKTTTRNILQKKRYWWWCTTGEDTTDNENVVKMWCEVYNLAPNLKEGD